MNYRATTTVDERSLERFTDSTDNRLIGQNGSNRIDHPAEVPIKILTGTHRKTPTRPNEITQYDDCTVNIEIVLDTQQQQDKN